jgi:hypothetical protein
MQKPTLTKTNPVYINVIYVGFELLTAAVLKSCIF